MKMKRLLEMARPLLGTERAIDLILLGQQKPLEFAGLQRVERIDDSTIEISTRTSVMRLDCTHVSAAYTVGEVRS